MINFIIAHAGDTHSSDIAASAHEVSWFIQLGLLVLASGVFSAIIYAVSKKVDTTILINSFALLIAGFCLFQIAPIVSATAITVGLISTLLVTLIGLGSK